MGKKNIIIFSLMLMVLILISPSAAIENNPLVGVTKSSEAIEMTVTAINAVNNEMIVGATVTIETCPRTEKTSDSTHINTTAVWVKESQTAVVRQTGSDGKTGSIFTPIRKEYKITVEKEGYVPFVIYRWPSLTAQSMNVICSLQPVPQSTVIRFAVTDENTTNPLIDATVTVNQEGDEPLNLVTNTDGQTMCFSVRPMKELQISIEKQGHLSKRATATFPYDQKIQTGTFTLKPVPSTTLINVVVKERGALAPINNAEVLINCGKDQPITRITGTDGRTGPFEVPTDSECKITCNKSGFAPLSISQTYTYSSNPKFSTYYLDALPKYTEINMHVVSRHPSLANMKEGVFDAIVTVSSEGEAPQIHMTDTEGRTGTFLVPTNRDTTITIEKSGYQKMRVVDRFLYKPTTIREIELKHTPETTAIAISFKVRGALTPINNAEVLINCGNDQPITRITGTNGRTGPFEVPTNSECKITCNKSGFAPLSVSQTYAYSSQLQIAPMFLELEPVTTQIELQFVDEDDVEVSDALVTISAEFENTQTKTTDKNGRTGVFTVPIKKTVSVYIKKSGYYPVFLTDSFAYLSTPQLVLKHLEREPTNTRIHITVINQDHVEVSDALVTISAEGWGPRPMMTGTYGMTEQFLAPVNKKCTISVEKDGYIPTKIYEKFEIPRSTDDVLFKTITIKKDVKLTKTPIKIAVTDKRTGAGISGARVKIIHPCRYICFSYLDYFLSTDIADTLTDTKGEVDISAVPTETDMRVEITKDGYTPSLNNIITPHYHKTPQATPYVLIPITIKTKNKDGL
jgi:hypothetical protein